MDHTAIISELAMLGPDNPVAPLGQRFGASRGAFRASAGETRCDFGAILEEK
jgi:hypothetical protein